MKPTINEPMTIRIICPNHPEELKNMRKIMLEDQDQLRSEVALARSTTAMVCCQPPSEMALRVTLHVTFKNSN
jgi:hypothetical protein